MSVALSGPFLSMLSAISSAFFSVVSNWSLQHERVCVLVRVLTFFTGPHF